MKAKTGVLVGVVLLCTLLGVVWVMKDDDSVTLPKTPPPVSVAPVVQEKQPASLEECYAKAEEKYKDYLETHAQKQPNAYGQETYVLPQTEWDNINTQRSDDYHECARMF